jgi:hypothetical protein
MIFDLIDKHISNEYLRTDEKKDNDEDGGGVGGGCGDDDDARFITPN